MLTSTQIRKLNAAVKTGATVLDEKYPTWFKKIDLDQLDLASCELCVAGQLGEKYLSDESPYGGYFGGFIRKLARRLTRQRRAAMYTDGDEYWGDVADALGFDFSYKLGIEYMEEGYAQLDRAWLREIRRRLKDAA